MIMSYPPKWIVALGVLLGAAWFILVTSLLPVPAW